MAFGRKAKPSRNEVNIRLLPEKAKRDYILRMVSFIIIMAFIIINFFLIFIPRINLINQINQNKRENYLVEMDYYNALEIYNGIPRDYYTIQRNNDYQELAKDNLNIEAIVSDINIALSHFRYSYLERITYERQSHDLIINTQFMKRSEVDDFILKLNEMNYIQSVSLDSRHEFNFGGTSGGLSRQKAIYTLTLDETLAPQLNESVGDWDD